MFTQRLATAVVAAALVVGMSGCALVEVDAPTPLTGIAACSLGKTWKLDTAKLVEAVTADLATRGITATVTVDGSQTLDWQLDSKLVMDTDYTVTATSGADATLTVVTAKHSGTTTGIAYINSEVAIPRDWDATGLNVDTTATVGGVAPEAVPYALVNTDIDDSVGVELTCDGGTMTTHQRGSDVTLTWTS